MNELIYEVYTEGRRLYTKALIKKKHFEFEIHKRGYRELDPNRSKLGAALAKGLKQTGIRQGKHVLYLGASHGYTPSYVSDMVGASGFVFCLDFAPRVVRDLYFLCQERENMAPLMENASHPEKYKDKVPKVDVVYQDIAQRDQVAIFLKNCDAFLKDNGTGLLAVKARSVDVTAKPGELFKSIKKQFENNTTYHIIDYRELDPYEKDHAFFVVRKRG